MKKLLVALSLVFTAAFAQAEVEWSWWMENGMSRPDVSFGLATKCASVDALELSLLYGGSPVSDGVQWSVFGINDSGSDCALQASFWFNRGNNPCVQLGMINVAKGPTLDLGLLNVADAAKFQLGFLNFNRKGFLPVFIIVNFDPDIFD